MAPRQPARDQNYISLGSWMLMILLTYIPLVNIIAIIVLAFAGENQSRKNFFRALILWFLIFFAVGVVLLVLGIGLAALTGSHGGQFGP